MATRSFSLLKTNRMSKRLPSFEEGSADRAADGTQHEWRAGGVVSMNRDVASSSRFDERSGEIP